MSKREAPAEFNSPAVKEGDSVLVFQWYSKDWLVLTERGTVVYPKWSSILAITMDVLAIDKVKQKKFRRTDRLDERPYKLAND